MKNFQTSMDILREDAYEEGLRKGREEAREEVRKEVLERLVLEMTRKGADVDTIREISRLDPQRILKLRSKIIP